jgi:hypothetical protein
MIDNQPLCMQGVITHLKWTAKPSTAISSKGGNLRTAPFQF